MPLKGGEEVLRDLQGQTAPPIIVLTADIQSPIRDESLKLGARDFVNKPVDTANYIKNIRNILRD